MARKRPIKKAAKTAAAPAPSTLHEVLRGRKTARHQRDSEKRAAQKLKRELEQDG